MLKYLKEINGLKTAIIIIVLVLLYFFTGINKNEQNVPNIATSDNVRMLRATFNDDSKIIKGYGLTIEVKNNKDIYSLVIDEINKINGLIDSFNSYNYTENQLAYNFVLRIPSEKINETISYFKSIGTVKSENVNAVDVSEQYLDTSNRLKNLYSRRNRLREMMKDKTAKLADIIAVDRELTNVQIEIERLETANKNIDKNIQYSKLELNVLPEIEINLFNDSQWQISTSWKKAINKSIIFGQKSVDFIFDLITLLPYIILLAILIIVIKRFSIIFIKNKNR